MPHRTEDYLSLQDSIDLVRTRIDIHLRRFRRRLRNEAEAKIHEEFDRRLASGEPYAFTAESVEAYVDEAFATVRRRALRG